MVYTKAEFKFARPIWLKNYEREINITALFEAFVPKGEKTTLTITAQNNYSLFINGELVFHGPARAGHGFFRVDRLDIQKHLTLENNRVCVLVNGYHCNSFYLVNQQAFLCAEIFDGEKMLCATGVSGWSAYRYIQKLQRVQRYAYQRTFCEVYDFRQLAPLCVDGLENEDIVTYEIDTFIEREVSYADLPFQDYKSIIKGGRVFLRDEFEPFNVWWLDRIGKDCTGYLPSELEFSTTDLVDSIVFTFGSYKTSGTMERNSYLTLDMRCNTTGLIYTELECISNATLVLTFDEVLTDRRVSYSRMDCVNAVVYKLKAGRKYKLVTAEPYTFKYINLISLSGTIRVESFGVIRTDFNEGEIIKRVKKTADEQIKRIYQAGVETFRQNTFDIYMDCPSRERAGWLCDSFFTSRVEHLMTGKSTVEHSFLSNFIMNEQRPLLPKGMLPMCYPADHIDGNFIPNWAMWYVIELKEYLERTGDVSFVQDIKDRIYALLDYFKSLENSDGLLERLKGWVFVEWSECNNLCQDINYPTNMLYYLFKNTIGELYGDDDLINEAQRLKKVINEQSKIGLFYCDNAVYNDKGEAVLSGKCTETCQYYAFFTGVADAKTSPELWNTLVYDFGPERKKNNKWKDIYFSNAFIGNYLRLDLLKRAGIKDQLDKNIRGYFDYMAKESGTLWENDTAYASCNHGFASHVLIWLDYLGYLEDK
ncbi:MAG: hypothetical protein J6B34_01835 [Clostridia bacterium]|nr:hypothetical protein [Clostridia bacterium]